MPTYKMHCQKCDDNFEHVESIKTFEGQAQCPACKTISNEQVYTGAVHFLGASVESAEYNPALGQIVKNSKHRKELAKQKGLIEIGTEKPETIHKHFDKARADKLKKSWDDI